MSYPSAQLSASAEARVFVARIESIGGYSCGSREIYEAVEHAVDAYPGPFFEAVRLAMVEIGDVAASDFKCVSEVRQYYPLSLPDDCTKCAAVVADIGERGHYLLTAIKESIDRQAGKAQTPQEVLSALMLIVRTCEDVNLERLFG